MEGRGPKKGALPALRLARALRSPTAWLHAIARYKLIDRLHKAGGRRALPIEDRDNRFTPDDPPDEAAGELTWKNTNPPRRPTYLVIVTGTGCTLSEGFLNGLIELLVEVLFRVFR